MRYALGFIGLGVPPPDTSLGALMGDGYAYLFVNNWLVVWPAIMAVSYTHLTLPTIYPV